MYDDLDGGASRRILVDRLWPRGVSRGAAPFDEWVKDVAPSTDLRKWYGHVLERFAEFADRYRGELHQSPASAALERLRGQARVGEIILLTATRDIDRSGAAVLKDVLAGC